MPRGSGRELYVGVTDYGWFNFLATRRDLDEVNFGDRVARFCGFRVRRFYSS